MAPVVTVEEVAGSKELARFVELPLALDGADPRFAPLVMAWERARLDPRRNPYFDRGDATYLLARRLGRPVGRIAAHVPEPGGEGRFGSWWAPDDGEVATALVAAARTWLTELGCASMVGPLSFTVDEEAGVQVAGFEQVGVTGRPWHPPHLARLLEDQDFDPVEDRPTWRLPVTSGGPSRPLVDDVPGQAGAYVDARLVLEGIAAVPDVSDALRRGTLRSAWALATRARARDWETCTVVRCTDDPADAIPALQSAAGRAGYRSVIAPWTPDPDQPPEAVHRVYRLAW